MPSRRVHNNINRILLGRDYDWLNKAVDQPSRLLGPLHRMLFHDPHVDPLLTLLVTGDPDAMIAHYIHIKTDQFFTRLKKKNPLAEKLLEKIIENL